MTPKKPNLTRKLRPTLPPGKWFLFFLIIIFFTVLGIILITETIRTTPNPLASILTTLIAIPATVTGILQFPYFRGPAQQSLEILQDALERLFNSMQNTFNHLVNHAPKTGQLTRHADWKILWAILSTGIALALFFNLLPTLSRLVIQPAYISCGNGLEISLQDSSHDPQGESIGISNGCYIFSKRTDALAQKELWDTQKDIADRFQKGNTASAKALWQEIIDKDSREAEARIYQMNQSILEHYPRHITIIIPTTLTGDDTSSTAMGKVTLQGAFIQQMEYNTSADVKNKKKLPLLLLIANLGSQTHFAASVAQQIIHLAQVDQTIIGTMGWSFSTPETQQAATILKEAHLVSISPTISSDSFKGISPYFLRIAPTDSEQSRLSAQFAKTILNAHKAVVFVDYANPYSSSLATGFSGLFTDEDHQSYDMPYKRGELASDSEKASSLVDAAFKQYPHADLFFFAGYSNDFDPVRGRLLEAKWANIPVMGGDGLYEQGGYEHNNTTNYRKLFFTAFAHYKLWETLKQPEPPFARDYPKTFDPYATHSDTINFTIAEGDAILSYDALGLLLTTYPGTYDQTPATKREDLYKALIRLDEDHPYFGLSGQISFSNNGGPNSKPFLLLCTIDGSETYIKDMSGRFTLNSTKYATIIPDSSSDCKPATNIQYHQK